ncbi:hypothetical protein TNCV_1864241 [Trichonephila clavipes]|nr:hypothetical protein TNCV_1864241 [Trichonephila clavipes]
MSIAFRKLEATSDKPEGHTPECVRTILRDEDPRLNHITGVYRELKVPRPQISSDINDFSAPVSHNAFVKVSSNKMGTYGSSTGDMHVADKLIGTSFTDCD